MVCWWFVVARCTYYSTTLLSFNLTNVLKSTVDDVFQNVEVPPIKKPKLGVGHLGKNLERSERSDVATNFATAALASDRTRVVPYSIEQIIGGFTYSIGRTQTASHQYSWTIAYFENIIRIWKKHLIGSNPEFFINYHFGRKLNSQMVKMENVSQGKLRLDKVCRWCHVVDSDSENSYGVYLRVAKYTLKLTISVYGYTNLFSFCLYFAELFVEFDRLTVFNQTARRKQIANHIWSVTFPAIAVFTLLCSSMAYTKHSASTKDIYPE